MQEIDSMDLVSFVELQVWKAIKTKEPRPAAIDEVWPWLAGEA